MVAVGSIIQLKGTNRILINKRSARSGINEDRWELVYGRIDQFEELEEALKREVREETGLSELKITKLLRVWHIFRGERSEENEIYGFTFICETDQEEVILSDEHSEYKWATVDEALQLIKVTGIKQDLELFKTKKDEIGPTIVSDLSTNLFTF